ncbi:MAG TPA: hypothetical protein VGK87_11175 [Anaerolineae bacterium]|jgi:hypothetical protein
MKSWKLISLVSVVLGLVSTSVVAQSTSQGNVFATTAGSAPQSPAAVAPAFTYQGLLKKSGIAVNGACDFQFSLYDDATAGRDLGNLTITNTNVVNGLFVVNLTYSTSLFDGNPRWLAISPRCPAGSLTYSLLSPRQAINSVPQAYSLVPGAVISGSEPNELKVNALANVLGNPFALHGIADGSSNLYPIYPVGVFGESHTGFGILGSSDNFFGVSGYSNAPDKAGVEGSSGYSGDGVRGSTTTGNGVNGSAISGNGVLATSSSGSGLVASSNGGYGITTTSTTGFGLYATSGGNGGIAAIYGLNTGGGYAVSGVSGNIGVFAQNNINGMTAYLGAGCCAADLYGNVNVTGDFNVTGAKHFIIDDPLDPANKTLQHAAIESPSALNFYNGSVILDAKGEATVQLPAYFNAINKDYQYQLTSIGAPGTGLYIAEEIKDNHFKIAGGTPGAKVSWQVTGVRNDPWAVQHPENAEKDKPVSERGYYLYPQGYGQPVTMTIQAARYGSQREP